MHAQRIAVAIAAGVGMICSVTPWVDTRWLEVLDATEIDRMRWSTILFWAAMIGGMFVGRRAEPLTPGGKGLCRVVGGVLTLVAALAIFGLKSKIDETVLGRDISISPSLYLALIAGVGIILLPNIVRTGTAPSLGPTEPDGSR